MSTASEIELFSEDHPQADGKHAQAGDTAWTITVPLEGGEVLHLHLGRKGRANLLACLYAEMRDQEQD